MTKSIKIMCTVLFCLNLCGCLSRSGGAFKQIGDSDYKVRFNFMNLFAVADGRPTYVRGVALLEDGLTPLKGSAIRLKTSDDKTIVSHTSTDHTGSFSMSRILTRDTFVIEVDSPDYSGRKEVTVEPGQNNWHEIIAHKK